MGRGLLDHIMYLSPETVDIKDRHLMFAGVDFPPHHSKCDRNLVTKKAPNGKKNANAEEQYPANKFDGCLVSVAFVVLRRCLFSRAVSKQLSCRFESAFVVCAFLFLFSTYPRHALCFWRKESHAASKKPSVSRELNRQSPASHVRSAFAFFYSIGGCHPKEREAARHIHSAHGTPTETQQRASLAIAATKVSAGLKF